MNPKLTIDYSKDGSHNFSNKKEASIGEIGQYEKRVRFNRFGAARQFVMRVSCSEPVVCDLLGAVAYIEGSDG